MSSSRPTTRTLINSTSLLALLMAYRKTYALLSWLPVHKTSILLGRSHYCRKRSWIKAHASSSGGPRHCHLLIQQLSRAPYRYLLLIVVSRHQQNTLMTGVLPPSQPQSMTSYLHCAITVELMAFAFAVVTSGPQPHRCALVPQLHALEEVWTLCANAF